jgi:hypothetical protein
VFVSVVLDIMLAVLVAEPLDVGVAFEWVVAVEGGAADGILAVAAVVVEAGIVCLAVVGVVEFGVVGVGG